jgi:hypothetical protein
MDDHSQSILSELFARWNKHAHRYGDVVYRSALARSGEVSQNIATILAPSRKNAVPESDLRVDYGDLLILRGRLPLGDARSILEGVLSHRHLRLPAAPIVDLNASIQATMVSRHGSHDRRFAVGFPLYEYPFQIQPSHGVTVPRGYLCKRDLPLYPHAYAAIQDYLGFKIINQGTPELIALAPDYRARVAQVRLARSAIGVTIEAPEGGESSIIAKGYFEDAQGRKQHFDLTFHDLTASIETAGYPRNLIIILLSRDDGDVIDEWLYNPSAGLDPGALMERSSGEDLDALILSGESETLEFKRQIPKGPALADTISAFANSIGGQILVGVDDNAEVVGCEGSKVQEKITQMVDHYCSPVPAFSVANVTIRDQQIIIITVPEGGDKPYAMAGGNGVYVRSGPTTRRANRYEIDRMYSSRGVLTPAWR